MKDSETRRYEMFLRVRDFGAVHAGVFASSTLGGELFARLNQLIADLDTHMSAQSSGERANAQTGTGKAVARDELRRDLEAISRTARSMALSNPGLEDKFRAPRSISDQKLLSLARSFATDALPFKAEFLRRGLRPDFLEDLDADIDVFEESITHKIRNRGARVAATVTIDEKIEQAMNTVRELDAIARNTFAEDPSNLAMWISASHTERAPRRARASQPTPPPTA